MLRERLNTDLKTAMKAREEKVVATLRLILAALKERDIAARSDGNYVGVGETEIVSLLQKMIKQRLQSIELYNQGGRTDLSAQEEAEIKIIETYVPQPLSDGDLKTLIHSVIMEINAQGLKDMKKVIELLKERAGDRIDFAKASPIIRDSLSN